MKAIIIVATGLTLVVLGIAGCVTGRGELTTSAERLDHSAYAFASTVTDETRSDHYIRDVQALSQDAHAFRRTTEQSDASDADVRAAFRQVSRSYLLVRDDVEHVDTTAAREDLRPVTHDYLNVERDMGGYPVRHDYSDRPEG